MLSLLPDDVKEHLVPFCHPILSGVNKDFRNRYIKYAKEALSSKYPKCAIVKNFPRALYQLDNLRLGLRVFEFDVENLGAGDMNVVGNSSMSLMFPNTFNRCMCFAANRMSWMVLSNAPDYFNVSTHDRICDESHCVLIDYKDRLHYIVLDLTTFVWREFFIDIYDVNYVAIVSIDENEIKIVYWKNNRSHIMWINFYTNETRRPAEETNVLVESLLMNADDYFVTFKPNKSIIPTEIDWIKHLEHETWRSVAVAPHNAAKFFQCCMIGDFLFFFCNHHCEVKCMYRGEWRCTLELPLHLEWHNWSVMGTKLVGWNVWPEFTEIIQYELLSPGMM